jgi:hypothetical protein
MLSSADNRAHTIARAKRIEWDHKHDREKVTYYDFESPGQLMEDFWTDVNRVVNKE